LNIFFIQNSIKKYFFKISIKLKVTGGYVLHAIKVAPPQNEQLNQREKMRALLDSMTNKNNNKAKETNSNPTKTIE
jgi:hypothetical protein